MNKQEYIDKITNSTLSADRKQKILDLLSSNELTFDIKEQIKDIIQEDIDSDTSLSSGEDMGATVQMENDLSAVEKELDADMQFVETELNDLEEMVKQVDSIVDQANIESLQSKIQEM